MAIQKTATGRWRVQVKHRGKVVADRTLDRKGDAERWEQEQKRALDLGTYIDPKRGRESLGEVVDRWMAARAHSIASKTLSSEGYALKAHLPATLRNKPISAIRAADLEALYGRMLGTLTRSTVSRFRNTVTSLFSWAVADGLITTNVAAASVVPRGNGQDEKQEIYPFNSAELLEVVAEARKVHPEEADLLLVLGTTGIRWGELAGMRARDVQLVPKPYFRVSQSAPDGQPIRTTTKGGKARSVPLTDAVLEVVKARLVGKGPNDLLFTTSAGRRLNGPNLKRKIGWTALSRGRRIQDLRHTAATIWLVELGIDPKTVQTWLGHSTMTLTVDTYSHFMGTAADDAGVAKMNALLGHASGTRARKLRAAK